MIEEYFKIALKTLSKRKTRSLLTVLGIFLGILTIFVLISLSLGLRDYVDEQFEMLGGDKFFIQPKGQAGAPGTSGGAVELTTDDVRIVERVRGIDEVAYFTAGNMKIEYNEEIRYYLGIGVPNEDSAKLKLTFDFSNLDIEDGRMLRKTDRRKVIAGYNYKYRELFSDSIVPGMKLSLNGVEFEVVGVLDAVGNPGDDQQLYIGMDDFKDLYNSGDRVDFIMARIKKGEEINVVATETEKRLKKFRDVDEKTQDFTILTPAELMETFGAVLNGITGFLVLIGLISAVVGGVGIANTMYTSVLERRKEIGTMKAVGARNADILSIFVIESGILGLIGGIIGVIVGAVIAKFIEFVVTVYVGSSILRASLSPYLILGCLAFGFIVGVVSGFIPSYQASKLKPVDALRYE